jgi:hypothetical protein
MSCFRPSLEHVPCYRDLASYLNPYLLDSISGIGVICKYLCQISCRRHNAVKHVDLDLDLGQISLGQESLMSATPCTKINTGQGGYPYTSPEM